MDYSVYVLESVKDGRLYIGVTQSVQDRISYHNRGRVRSTKGRRPFRLLGSKTFDSFRAARAAEVLLKRFKDPVRVRSWILA